MRVSEGEKIVTLTPVEKDEEEETPTEETVEGEAEENKETNES